MSFVLVMDNVPLEFAPWMRDITKIARLKLVDNDLIVKKLSEKPAFQKALLDNPLIRNFQNPHPSLAPHYREALNDLKPGDRIAFDGWGWLVFAEKVDACVFDFSGLEAEKKKPTYAKTPPKQVDAHFEKVKDTLRQAAKKVLQESKILELPAGLTDPQKKAKVQEFLKRLGQ